MFGFIVMLFVVIFALIASNFFIRNEMKKLEKLALRKAEFVNISEKRSKKRS
jgi:hypothetical protein